MDEAEYSSLLAAQEAYLNYITEATVFTAELLCKMHRDWLGEIYEWAGTYRAVDVSKGGLSWPPAYRVSENMSQFETEILSRKTPCRHGDRQRVAEDIAIVHAELLLIHPFREGNGRLARWVADLMSLQAKGPIPDYGFEVRGSRSRSRRYLDAVIQGYERDYADLARFFFEALERGAER